MRSLITAAAGVAAGFYIVRQTRRRRASERFAAASLEALLNAVDANDADTGHHVRRVATYALILAEAADVDETQRRSIERVALFHDIGKIHEALFDIIHEHSKLTPAERRAIATHPKRGAEVLAPLTPFYPDLSDGVIAHHERWDGSGYPHGLRGDEIPLAARIVTLADTFDAITHSRRYRSGRPATAAIDAIAAGRGTQFDPELTDLMLSPPVMARLLRARRSASALPKKRPTARRRERAVKAPDVEFRWHSRSTVPTARTARTARTVPNG